MLCCVDVGDHAGATALVAADAWDAHVPAFECAWWAQGHRGLDDDLPFILAMLAALEPTAVVVRATPPELGARLAATMIPVIVVADGAVVAAHGMSVGDAAALVQAMPVGRRGPVLVERAEALAAGAVGQARSVGSSSNGSSSLLLWTSNPVRPTK